MAFASSISSSDSQASWRSRAIGGLRVVLSAAAGLILALGLFALLTWMTHFEVDSHLREIIREKAVKSAKARAAHDGIHSKVAFRTPDALREKIEKPKEIPSETELTHQVVETAKPLIEQKPDVANYLSNHDNKTDREQKSLGKKLPGRDLGKALLHDPSALQSPQSTSKDPTQIADKPHKMVKGQSGSEQQDADARPPDEGQGPAPVADAGQTRRSGSPVVRGKDDGLLLPATSPGNILHNIQALSGNPGNNDYLPDVEDEGDTNILNTRRFKHFDFFQRVKDRVAGQWEPGAVWRSRDPTGQRFGVRPRLTVLRVTLDPEGALKRMTVSKESGLVFLDDEAKRAFTAAAPFPNPPHEMVKNGEIEFQFGFMFEISSQRFKFKMPTEFQ